MIPTLLWQCPLCHVDDALKHKGYWFRPDEVLCTQCGAVWQVQRVIGSDYLLEVTRGEPSVVGQQLPLGEWYDSMKAGLRLVAREADALLLEPGEELYVQSGLAELLAEEDSPLFDRWDEQGAPRLKDGDLGLSLMKRWDVGQLYLTSERLLWVGERGKLSLWLGRVNSVHTEITWYLGLLYGLCRYKFRFHDESVLKWLTYIALVARRLEAVSHHRISLSDY